MKQLNTHLETRLEEQERKLCLVTTELSKTWHVVGRLRRHHHQLHTHEKILKYELQQKRKLLNELKEELECCREKWEQAREKNTQSEKDWKKLRAEFSSRKTKPGSPSFNNSGESGYSDERPSDESSESNDESEYVTEPPVRCKKKLKKSFETILDSSTDFNLAAEREDPASDMLDVADLPLDTQDESHSEQKSIVLCEETEDEIGEITIDSCIEDVLSTDCNNENANMEIENISKNETTPETSSQNVSPSPQTLIDPAEILKNIKQQNERLARKDQKLENLEKGSANLLSKVKNTNKFSEQINSTLDHILKQSRSSREQNTPHSSNADNETIINESQNLTTENENTDNTVDNSTSATFSGTCEPFSDTPNETFKEKELNDSAESSVEKDNNCENPPEDLNLVNENTTEPEPSTSNDIDHEARFAARDLRLKRLEEQTKSLVSKVNKTTSKGVKINYKLEELHNIYGSESSRAGTPSENTEESISEEETQNE